MIVCNNLLINILRTLCGCNQFLELCSFVRVIIGRCHTYNRLHVRVIGSSHRHHLVFDAGLSAAFAMPDEHGYQDECDDEQNAQANCQSDDETDILIAVVVVLKT
jgi:hypothetical protein